MASRDIYYTWPDQRFRYDCASCGACCRGLGIGLDQVGGQAVELAELYPELQAFFRTRGSAWTAFNPRGRCWFLDDGGLCRVEVDHGRDTKPASCRLFPFNRIFQLGRTRIIDFNSVICPMEIAGEGHNGISHAEILADIDAVKDPAVVGTVLDCPGGDAAAVRWVSHERRIAKQVFKAAETQSGDLDALWCTMADARGGAGASRASLSRALAFITGRPWLEPDAETMERALWLTPSMRFNEAFGPRRATAVNTVSATLADVWLGWLHFLALGAKLARRALTMQEATTVWSEVMPLLDLAVRWDSLPRLKVDSVSLPESGPERVWAHDFARGCKAGDKPIGEVVQQVVGGLELGTRVVALRALEPVLSVLSFEDERPRPRRSHGRRRRG